MRTSASASPGKVLYAQPAEDIVIVRVVGRGALELSPALRNLARELNRYDYSPAYVIDLEQCPALDSTFMGTIASIGLHQTACRKDRAVVVHTDPTTRRQMGMLGLGYLLDVRPSGEASDEVLGDFPAGSSDSFDEAELASQTRFERIVHMIESHEALIDVSSGNETKFRAVLETLSESLALEKPEGGGYSASNGGAGDRDSPNDVAR